MFITCILKTRFWKSFERCGECKENWSKGKTGKKMFVAGGPVLESVRMKAQIVSKRGCCKTCRHAKYFMAKWSNSLDQHTNASEKEYCQISNLVFCWNSARMKPKSKFCDLQPPEKHHFKIQRCQTLCLCIYKCKAQFLQQKYTLQHQYPDIKLSSVVPKIIRDILI